MFNCNAQAVCSPLLQSRLIRIESDTVQIDPQLLFQRLIIACNRSDDLEELFLYELCSYRVALFDSPQTLRQPQRSILTDALRTKQCHSMPFQGQLVMFSMYWMVEFYSIEFHGLKSPQPIRIYVSGLYCSYATKKYGNTIVWFGGYDGISTKNMTHQRRAAGKARATVTFMEDLIVTLKKDNFFANSKNKQWFINLLSRFLQENNCPTYYVVLIVGQPKNLLEKRTLSLLEMARIYLCCCVSTPVQIAMTYISCQNQGQTPEDESGT